jgi:NADPH2:quinone reductase
MTMRAVVLDRNGGPEVLREAVRPVPTPGSGELLVRLAAGGVNFRDVLERRGGHGGTPPIIAGIEGSGTVTEVGPQVDEFAVGDRVAWDREPGSWAEYVLVRAQQAVAVPVSADLVEAAAVILQGMTAQALCASVAPVEPGESVLVHAAAGGVGLMLTQLAKLRGARVIGTASTDAKRAVARAAGADAVIPYEDFARSVRELTDGQGVAAVYDGVGAATLDGSLSSLRPRGVMASYGWASGPLPPLDTQRLRGGGSLVFTRASLHDYTATRAELVACGGEVLGALADGRLDVRIAARFDFDQAGIAQRELESRQSTGKLLMMP